jgi:signal transduction histidine kinase/ligand-binding sensor domain-containing protein
MQRLVIFSFFALLAIPIAFAQQNRQVSLLSTDQGLSQGSNHFKYEDSQGFMWITANDAMNRYDGSTVKVYNLNRYFEPYPVLHEGLGFVEDSATNIFIGSANGLYQYVRKEDKFQMLPPVFQGENQTTMPICLLDDVLYCFNHLYQFVSYHTKTGKVRQLPDIGLSQYKSVHIYDLEGKFYYNRFPKIDKQGQIWFAGEKQIQMYDTKVNKFRTLNMGTTQSQIWCQEYDPLSHLLYVGKEQGLDIIHCQTQKIEHITALGTEPLSGILSIDKRAQQIVLVDRNMGLLATDTSFSFFRPILYPDQAIIRNNGAHFDKIGRIWVGEDGIGQWIIDEAPPFLRKGIGPPAIFEEFKDMGVNYFAELPGGKIIVRNSILFDTITEQLSKFGQLKVNIRCQTDTLRKGVWAWSRTPSQGIQMYFVNRDLTAKQIPIQAEAQFFGSFQDLKVLADGRILCAFYTGLYWFLPDSGSFERVLTSKYDNCFYISLIDDKTVAVSYLNQPMQVFQISSTGGLNPIHSFLPDVQAYYLQKDAHRNRYWVGTTSGVYLLDKDFKTIRNFDPNTRLAGSNIYGLLLDHVGNCYASHQHGLSSIDAETFHIINFTKEDGIQDWDYNNRAFYKSTSGTLYFGGVSGFNYIKPPMMPRTGYETEVYLDEIWINQTALIPYQKMNGGTVALGSEQNQLTIKARLKNLSGSAGAKICYRFKGIDNTWKYCDIGTDIILSALAPGSYTLELGYYQAYTNLHTAQKEFLFSIATPFYQTSWFLLLCSFLGFSFVYWLFYRAQMRRQMTAHNRERALTKQRTDITADLHDEIGSTLSSLQLNSSVALAVLDKEPQKAKQILQKIEDQAKNLSDKIGDIIWSIKPRSDEFMTISGRLKNFIAEILDSSHIKYSIQIDEAIDHRIIDAKTRKNTVLLVKEAINNAAKYSKASHLALLITCTTDQMQISIVDNGIGFDSNQPKVGNGLTNMRRRALELNGQFELISSPGAGTTIIATFPIVT